MEHTEQVIIIKTSHNHKNNYIYHQRSPLTKINAIKVVKDMLSKLFTLTSMLLIASPVYASWQSSSMSINFFWLVIVPFFLIHLISSTVLNLKGEYKSRKVAFTHFQIASLFPLLGIVILMYEFFENYPLNYYYMSDYSLGLIMYSLLIGISALPYIMCRTNSE